MILLIFFLRHAGLCGILGDESLRPSIFCHQLNKYLAYLYINHCHHRLSLEKYFYNTTKHFYLWVFSWGFKFWVIDVFIYHHCLSFLPKKKKKKKSINKSLVSYTSFMNFKRVIWLSKCCFDSSWLLLLWVGFTLNFLHLIHIPHISKRAIGLYLAIRLYHHWA